MKVAMLPLFFLANSVYADLFVHPMEFKNTEAQKSQVISYIKAKVRQDYCNSDLDMCDNLTLRAMEQENLNAFKNATKATNRRVMDKVISDYCNSGLNMCDYITIYSMYVENVNAGEEELTWD